MIRQLLNQSFKFDRAALVLAIYGVLSFCAILFFGDLIYEWHSNGTIDFIASDASNYLEHFLLSDQELARYFVSGPVALMIIFDGNLHAVLCLNLLLLLTSLNSVRPLLATSDASYVAILLLLAFPHILVGPFSLNKEVFLFSSCLYFLSYLCSGSRSCLVAAFLIAPLARYYMLFVFVFVLVTFPRRGSRIRWGLVALCLGASSLIAGGIDEVADFAYFGYSRSAVLDESSGAVARLFSELQLHGLYWLIYPVKYVVLPSLRIWSLIGSGIETSPFNLVSAVVSMFSLVSMFYAIFSLRSRRSSPLVRQLIWIGLLAPIPIMVTEIGHWRYFCFVYVFFVVAAVKAREEKRIGRRRDAAERAATATYGTAAVTKGPALSPGLTAQ